MPNIKSSILSVKTDAMRRAKNVSAKSAIKTASRKVLDAVAAGNAEEAKALLVIAMQKNRTRLLLTDYSIKIVQLAVNLV